MEDDETDVDNGSEDEPVPVNDDMGNVHIEEIGVNQENAGVDDHIHTNENTDDKCVANSIIAGKQCMILWHVDDLKISHIDKNVVEDILKKPNEKFRHESPLTTSRGKVLDYLGMKFDYQQKGKVKFVMYEYINKMLE